MASKSNKIRKIELKGAKKTLFITLYAKATDYHSKHSILNDKKAAEMAEMFNHAPEKLNEYGHNEITVVRARQLDEWIREFIAMHPNAIVLNLGCGLDTRVSRVHPPTTVQWFDVDFPDVIKLRKNFFSNSSRYHMISSSVTQKRWLDSIPKGEVIIVAEGMLEYLRESDVEKLFNRLTDHFSSGEMVFDVMNSFGIKMGREELKKTMGAEHRWAVDDLKNVEKLDPKLKRVRAISVFRSKYMHKLEFKKSVMYGGLSAIPHFHDIIRLLLYRF